MARKYTPEEQKKVEKEVNDWAKMEREKRKNPLYTGSDRRELSMVEEIAQHLQD